MRFEKKGVAADSYGSFGKMGDKFALPAGGSPKRAGELHRVGGVKADGMTERLHDGDRSKVADEVVVAKRGASIGEKNAVATNGSEFFDDVFHVVGREKLPFFHIDGCGRSSRGGNEIGLATEKGGDLDHVTEGACEGGLFRRMDVGDDGQAEFILHALENGKPFFEAGPAEREDGGAVRFVVGGFENEGKGVPCEDFLEFFSAKEGVPFAFHDTGAAEEGKFLPRADRNIL